MMRIGAQERVVPLCGRLLGLGLRGWRRRRSGRIAGLFIFLIMQDPLQDAAGDRLLIMVIADKIEILTIIEIAAHQ